MTCFTNYDVINLDMTCSAPSTPVLRSPENPTGCSTLKDVLLRLGLNDSKDKRQRKDDMATMR